MAAAQVQAVAMAGVRRVELQAQVGGLQRQRGHAAEAGREAGAGLLGGLLERGHRQAAAGAMPGCGLLTDSIEQPAPAGALLGRHDWS